MSSMHKVARSTSVLTVAIFLAASLPGLAQESPVEGAPASGMGRGCSAFKWPLDVERKALDNPGIEQVASGTVRGSLKDQAFALTLQPDASVAYDLPPGKKSKNADTPRFGGIVSFAAPEKAGIFQVTLSSEGWIDLVQQGAAVGSAGHSGVKDCPGLRKSVRFKIGDAPVVLQISGAPADTIKVAIRAIE
jgi:hypothetical protein